MSKPRKIRISHRLMTVTALFLFTIGCGKTYPEQEPVRTPETIRSELGGTIPVETALDHTLSRPAVEIWLDMINNARTSIDLGQFYMCSQEGEALETVIQALLNAHQRGVAVRILTDVNMNRTYPELADYFRQQGIDVRLFDWRELTGGVLHAKYMIVDQASVYVGSQNFDWRALKHIHETGVRVDHPVFAGAAAAIFQADWRFAGGDPDAYAKLKQMPPFEFPETGRLLASPAPYNPPGIASALDHLIAMLDKAERRITVQLLSYSTRRYRSEETFSTIDDALRRAAARGVDVEMIISNWNKRHPEDLMSLSAVPGIRIRFMNIPEASTGFVPFARVVHSKIVRVDDRTCWISTSNWSYDYFYASRNLEVVLEDRELAMQLDRLFTDLWNCPYGEDVEPDGTYEPPRRE